MFFRFTTSNEALTSRPIVLALALGLTGLPFTAMADAAPSAASAELPQLLEQQGWQAQTGTDGVTIYRPPAQTAAQSGGDPTAVPESNMTSDNYQRLRDSGWEVRKDDEGNTLLIPPAELAPDRAQNETTASKKSTTPASVLPTTAAAPPPDLKRLLEERGWRLEYDASGNTLLVPMQSGQTSNRDEVTESSSTGDAAPTDPFSQFQRSLKDKGWRVEAAEDGAVLVYPPASPTTTAPARSDATPAQRGDCAGISSAAVINGTVSLPIDSWGKAERVATDWVTRFGHPDRIVGKIRRVNWVYVVSVVDRSPPYLLRNQLIIRADTGRVTAIH